MPIVTVTQPADGQTADANDVNLQVDAILAVLNGGIDSANIADGGVTNAKLAGGITIDKLAASSIAGWAPLGHTPNSVTALGNRSYQAVFNSLDLTGTMSPGMRLQLTRTTAAPHQSTLLNGSNQFYSKSSPSGMTFTDDFVVSAWVKVTSYVGSAIISRYNGTSGWSLQMSVNGTIQLNGYNAGSSNVSFVASLQAIPLNRWVHIAAQLDMSSFTASSTTSYIMIDGDDVPATVSRGGSNPTALIQAGNLEIGSQNGGTVPFPGAIAQAAIYSAKVTEATILASISQTLVGTETSLASAYSFNNSINDLNANANNLTANGSAVATNADSPFAQGATAGTIEYGILTSIVFSTNTTVTIQMAEGSALPSGLNAIAYSPLAIPYLFPAISKFKLTVPDVTLGATLVKYVLDHPIDSVAYTNTGTAGGFMFLDMIGSKKTARGTTGTISLSSQSSAAFLINWPASFFATVQGFIAAVTGTAGTSQFTGIGGNAATNATTVSFYFISTANTSITATNTAGYSADGI